MTTSFVTQLKNIAGTAIDLARATSKIQIAHAVESARQSWAGKMLDSVRKRSNSAPHAAATEIKIPAVAADAHHIRVQDEYSFSKKRHLGDKKYAANTEHFARK